MIESDTIKLLRECDAGIKMGISSVDDSMAYVQGTEMKALLEECKNEHEKTKSELQELLKDYHDDGKEPPAMAKGMSWIKTNFKLSMDNSDSTVAGLITDGCDMGVKSLSGYLNEYEAADEKSKDIAKKLIKLEERISVDMRKFL